MGVRHIVSSAAVAVVMLSATTAWAQRDRPREGACFYEDKDFRGRYFCAPAGSTVSHVPSGANDQVSSIQLFGNVEVRVYRDENFRGSSKRFDRSVSNLAREGFNDRISSYRIERRTWGGAYGGGSYGDWDDDRGANDWSPGWGRPTPSAGVCFYADRNFSGRYFCERIGSNVRMVPSNTNDKISSIRVFGNAAVTVYQDRDYSGRSGRFDYDTRDLRREGWDDTISSFRVTSRGSSHGGYGGAYGGGSWDSGHGHTSKVTRRQAEDIVRRAYRSVLQREPDPGSAGYVNKVMYDHWTEQQVKNELMKSAEYRAKHGRR